MFWPGLTAVCADFQRLTAQRENAQRAVPKLVLAGFVETGSSAVPVASGSKRLSARLTDASSGTIPGLGVHLELFF